MKFARIVFLVAGVYGVIVLTPMYFLESTISEQTPPTITHPEFFYGFVGVGVAWQILFLIIASDPLRLRLAMIPSVLEKISFAAACIVLYSSKRIAIQTLALSCVDLLFAILFVVSFIKTHVKNGAA